MLHSLMVPAGGSGCLRSFKRSSRQRLEFSQADATPARRLLRLALPNRHPISSTAGAIALVADGYPSRQLRADLRLVPVVDLAAVLVVVIDAAAWADD